MTEKKFKLPVKVYGPTLADMLNKTWLDMSDTGDDFSDEQAELLRLLKSEPDMVHDIEIEVGPEVVHNLIADPDVSPELRAEAEAFLTSLA